MGVESIVTSIALVGGFVVGLWYIFTRKDVSISARQGMNPEGLRYGSGAPGFGSAKKEIDRKLALVETRRRRQQAISSRLAVENAERLAREQLEHSRIQQEAERQMMMENARVAAQEEARLASEAAQKVREEQEEARRREEEEARLAIERENQRQADFLAAEESRLAEIAAAQQQQIASSSSNSKAIKELQARLAREGAKSSDVQVSLMWNNYNDLDLHIVCPSGERIHGGNKTSACGGELDVDANVRAETRKPVENVFWPEGTAPGGQYHVYVHYYKKHKKRRSKDPTKFQVIANAYGDLLEYSGELNFGEEIQLVCSFNVPTMEEREEIKRQLEQQVRLAETGEVAADKILEDEETPKQMEFGELVDEIENELADDVEDDGSGVPPAPDLG